MKRFIKAKYQYILLLVPFSIIFIGAIAMINYAMEGRKKRIFQIIVLIPIYGLVLGDLYLYM